MAMFRLSLIGIIGLLGCLGTHAQDLRDFQCPAVYLVAPTVMLEPGEKARFAVRLEPKNAEWPLKYYWHISSGKIVSGQGTDTIEVQPAIHYVTATVSFAGFPRDDHCPNSASEMVVGTSRRCLPPGANKPEP